MRGVTMLRIDKLHHITIHHLCAALRACVLANERPRRFDHF
jgi:hypothetical protein